jgi:hypothetical protein
VSTPNPWGAYTMRPSQLRHSAERVERALGLLESLDPSQLAPAREEFVGHPALARALRESRAAWARGLKVITDDLARFADELRDNAAATERGEQDAVHTARRVDQHPAWARSSHDGYGGHSHSPVPGSGPGGKAWPS